MENTTVFSKTGKGLLEVKNRSNRISKEQYRVLSLIDGKANLDELADRARTSPTALRQILTQLSEGGYIKVLVSSTSNDGGMGTGVMTGSYYVDDLDFTAVLGPAGGKRPSIYQSTETERRQRESAERKAAEAASAKKREESERRKQDEAAQQAQEEARARQLREAAERKAKEEAQRVSKLEAELKARLEAERKAKEMAVAKARAEAEAKVKAELDRQIREATLKKQQEEEAARRTEAEERARAEAEARRLQEEAARKLREEHERQRKEAEARALREEEERQRQEAAARKLREEEERQRKQAEERRRQEEEARKRREEEERQRKEAEARARREEEERVRREEEARKRKEEEERQRKEAEARALREEQERLRQEEEARKRQEEEERQRQEAEARARREEEERLRKEEEARKLREEEQRKRKEEERKRMEEERKRKEAEEQARIEAEKRVRIEAEERRRQEEMARKQREQEERQRKEAEELARRKEVERQRQEDQARILREEEENKRQEAEARARAEVEAQRRQEEEARARRDEELRQRLEAEARALREEEEVRKLREESARQAREAAERERAEALAEQKRLEAEVQQRKASKRGKHSPAKQNDFEALSATGAAKSDEETWLMREIGIATDDPVPRQRAVPADADAFAELAAQSWNVATTSSEPERAAVSVDEGIPVAQLLPPLGSIDIPDVAEVDEAVSARASIVTGALELDLSVSLDAMTPGVFEGDIVKALEEQERRVRMEEEARAALERAEVESQMRAEREAREIAEAGERARREAADLAREESERLAREDKERRELEEEERRRQREVDRRMREQQRQEAERRKREEDLARQRKEQEERESRKAERERVHKEIRRSHVTPLRILAAAALVLVGLVGAIVQFASLSPWAPDIERIATQRIGEPVRIASVRASLLPRVEIILEGVTVGASQDVQAKSVALFPQIMSLVSEQKLLDELHVRGVTMTAESLTRAGSWGGGPGAKEELVSVPLVKVSELTLNIPGVNLPTLGATIRLGQRGEVLNASVQTTDDHLHVDFLPRGSDIEVLVKGRNFTFPVGPAIEVMDLQGKGTIAQGELRVTSVEYFLLGGQGTADFTARWKDGWNVESNFAWHRLSLESGMRAFGIDVLSDGSLDAKGIARMRSEAFQSLLAKPEFDASFTVQRGNLAGFDLPRALQQRGRDGVQGGKTRFEELSGILQSNDGRYQFRSVKLQAGILRATGQLDISPSEEVSGKVQAELRSTAGLIRGSFNISGNSQATLLKP